MIKFLAVGALVAMTLSSQAQARVIYSEDFSESGFIKGSDGSFTSTSERWAKTNYYYASNGLSALNNVNGWTFSGQVEYAQNSNEDDNGGVLLNEGVASSASTTISGLTVGKAYNLTFSYWGDNEPNSRYGLDVFLNGVKDFSVADVVEGAAGSTSGNIGRVSFTADSTTLSLMFAETTPDGSKASPVFSNVALSTSSTPTGIPEPGSAFGICIFGMGISIILAQRKGMSPKFRIRKVRAGRSDGDAGDG